MRNKKEGLIGSHDYEFRAQAELTEGEFLNAQALFSIAVAGWLDGHMEGIQTFRHSDQSVRPVFRIDQSVPDERGVTVLFERMDGPIEDSEFILRNVVRTNNASEVMGELADEGYQIYPASGFVEGAEEQIFRAA
jgi:hypothetical protein